MGFREFQSRLIARAHQNGATRYVRISDMLRRIAARYREAMDGIVAVAAALGPHSSTTQRYIDALLEWVRRHIELELTALGFGGYHAAAGAVVGAVTNDVLPFFLRAAVEARRPITEQAATEYGYNQWRVRYDWATLTSGPLTAEQARSRIHALLFPPPSADHVREWLTKAVPGGMSWDARLRRWSEAARNAMLNELTVGLSQGENIDQLRQRLEPICDGVSYKAQRIARTEGSRVAERGARVAYEQLGRLLSGMQIVAVLDQWTRPEHAARHGRVYNRDDDGVYRDAFGNVLPDLPDAPNCRCMAIPIVRPPREFAADPALRAIMGAVGEQYIADPYSYTDWWNRVSERERMAAVGVRRYNAMVDLLAQRGISRAPEWIDFIGPDGQLLSVDALRAESVADFEARRARLQYLIDRQARQLRMVVSHGTVVGQFPLPSEVETVPAEIRLSELELRLRIHENRIANEPIEHLLGFDANGNVVFESVGDERGVGIPNQYRWASILRNMILSHNHPISVPLTGTPPSAKDVGLLQEIGGGVVRVITPMYTFEMRITRDEDPYYIAGQLRHEYERTGALRFLGERQRLLTAGYPDPLTDTRLQDYLWAEVLHHLFLDYQDRFGVSYTRMLR